MIQAPGGPIIDFAKQVGDVASLATNPTNKTKQAQALMDIAPVGLQGALETGPLRDQTSVSGPNGTRVYQKQTDLASHTGMYARSPEEERVRALGLRSQNEVFNKDQAYAASSKDNETQSRLKDISNQFYDAIVNGDKERAADLQRLHVALTGQAISDSAIEKQIMDQHTTAVQRALTAKKTIEALKNAAKLKKNLDEHNQ
jgi:hypothetical protein